MQPMADPIIFTNVQPILNLLIIVTSAYCLMHIQYRIGYSVKLS